MSTEEQSPTWTIGRPRRMRHNYWPARLRVLRILAKLMLAGLVLAAFTAGVCRVTRMIGLPDVGDPFGPGAPGPAARAGADPMPLYAQAARQLMRVPSSDKLVIPRTDPLTITWAKAGQPTRQWVQENREALDLFARASALPAVPWNDRRTDSRSTAWSTILNDLVWLALLEGDRLADLGDMKGAWSWYLAALRSTYHRAQGNDVYERFFIQRFRGPITDRIGAWAEDPEAGPELLRGALDDVLACRRLMPSDARTLENGYRMVMLTLEGGHHRYNVPRDPSGRPRWSLPLLVLKWEIGRFLDSEPERSRRVARLAFANWRAWLARPEGERPRPAVKLLVLDWRMTHRLDFFEPGPDAPAAARRMSPGRLASWAETCRDGTFPLSDFWSTFRSTRASELQSYRNIVVELAEQLYLRERGTLPPNPEALVGTYLEKLPDDGSSGADDGTTPVVGTER